MSPRARTGLLAVGFTGLLFTSIGVLVAGLVAGNSKQTSGGGGLGIRLSGPTEEKEGAKWSIEELVEHLKSSGMKDAELAFVNREVGTRKIIKFAKARGGQDLSTVKPEQMKDAVEVYTFALGTAASNKDAASKRNNSNPGTAIGWGRFLIIGDPKWIAKIRDSLS